MISARLLKGGDPVNWGEIITLTGADPESLPRLKRRDSIAVVLVKGLPSPAASILKQCMLSGGADALVHRDVLTCGVSVSSAAVYGTPRAIARGCESMAGQPFSLGDTAAVVMKLLQDPDLPPSITINGAVLEYRGTPLIMGIINATPDSFSDGGSYSSPEAAADMACRMAEQGAALVDVGGESTRPGSGWVSAEEQISRVIPVISAIRERCGVPVSVDTRLPEVARTAVAAGAGMINSVNALESPGMADAAAELGVPVCLMHMLGTPDTMQDDPGYTDVIDEVGEYLLKAVERAVSAGVRKERILVDPGIGFGKRLEDNLALLGSLEHLKRHTGCRVLLGHSRKSFIKAVTGIKDPGERDCVTHIVSILARGADMVRVHDVAGSSSAFAVADALGVMR